MASFTSAVESEARGGGREAMAAGEGEEEIATDVAATEEEEEEEEDKVEAVLGKCSVSEGGSDERSSPIASQGIEADRVQSREIEREKVMEGKGYQKRGKSLLSLRIASTWHSTWRPFFFVAFYILFLFVLSPFFSAQPKIK